MPKLTTKPQQQDRLAQQQPDQTGPVEADQAEPNAEPIIKHRTGGSGFTICARSRYTQGQVLQLSTHWKVDKHYI